MGETDGCNEEVIPEVAYLKEGVLVFGSVSDMEMIFRDSPLLWAASATMMYPHMKSEVIRYSLPTQNASDDI